MPSSVRLAPYLEAIGLLAAANAFSLAALLLTPLESVSAIFVLPVLISAARHGTETAIVTALLATLLSTLFYPPLLSPLVVRAPQLVDLVIFVVVALVVGSLAGRLRQSMLRAQDSERRTRQLYALASEIAAAITVAEIHEVVTRHIATALDRPAAVFVGTRALGFEASYAPFRQEDTAALADLAAALPAVAGETSGDRIAQVALPGGGLWLLCALGEREGLQAVIAVELGASDHIKADHVTVQVRPILAEAAKSLERLGVTRALEERRLRQRSDELRDILMESVSHELRTPMVSILGAATVIADAPTIQSEPRLYDLAHLVASEAKRLDLRIQNLLDVTRIRSGALQPRLDRSDPADIVNAALDSASERLREQRLVVALPADLPMVDVDPILIEQALINILENAAKYAPSSSTITVSGGSTDGMVWISVKDEGPGLDLREAEQVFERFYRGERHADISGGSGLGLTIAKTFVEANGGSVVAESQGMDKGTTMSFSLPVAPLRASPDHDDD
jgi:two-component system, OmpR family, sensor histidine kinase KdpD